VERRKRVLLLQILVIIGVQLLVVSLFYSFPNYQAVLLLLLWSMIGKGFGIFCGKLARVWNPWVILVLGEIILIVAGLNLISGWDLRDIAQRILEMKAKGSQF
jgi:hypothetical protein